MRSVLFIIIFVSSNLLFGQDPVFDLSYQNRLLMNPAFAGNGASGKYRAALFHHNQFINNRGTFNFSSFSLDYGLCNAPISFGVIAQNETQGDGFLTTNSFAGIFSVTPRITERSYLSAGIQMTGYSYGVDWSKYVFSDQLDAVKGITNSSSNISPSIRGFTNGITLGVNYTFWQRKNKWVANLGGTYVNGINQPRLSLISSNAIITPRTTLHCGLLYKRQNHIIDNASEVTLKYDNQGNYNTLVLLYGYYFNQYLLVEGGTRLGINSSILKNTHKPLIGFRLMPNETMKIVLCYGFNSKTDASGLGHGIELGIVIVSKRKFCNPLGVFNPNNYGGGSNSGGSGNGGRSSGGGKRKGNGKVKGRGRERIECPVYLKTKVLPTF